MNDFTPEQKNKLLAAAETVGHGDMAVILKILEFQDFINENREKINNVVARAEQSIARAEGVRSGSDGIDGKDGKDGERGPKGIDGRDGKDGRDGRDGLDGTNGTDGVDGKDGSPDTPREVRDKLETLKDDERLDISAIKGFGKKTAKLSDEIINRAIGIVDQRTSFLINKVSNLQTQVNNFSTSGGGHTIQDEGTPLTQRTNLNFVGAGVTVTDDSGNNATVVTISTSAGAGYQAVTGGAINGTNTVFTWAVAPNAIVVDGQSLRKTASDGTTNWTGTTTTTLTIAPTFDIYGVA